MATLFLSGSQNCFIFPDFLMICLFLLQMCFRRILRVRDSSWTKDSAITFKYLTQLRWVPPYSLDTSKIVTFLACILKFFIPVTIILLWRFGATYVGTKQTGPTEAYPVLLGDIDPSGNLNANILHQLAPRLKGKLATQVQNNKFTAVQMSADYRGDSYTASLTVGNPDVINGTGKDTFLLISLTFKK